MTYSVTMKNAHLGSEVDLRIRNSIEMNIVPMKNKLVYEIGRGRKKGISTLLNIMMIYRD